MSPLLKDFEKMCKSGLEIVRAIFFKNIVEMPSESNVFLFLSCSIVSMISEEVSGSDEKLKFSATGIFWGSSGKTTFEG